MEIKHNDTLEGSWMLLANCNGTLTLQHDWLWGFAITMRTCHRHAGLTRSPLLLPASQPPPPHLLRGLSAAAAPEGRPCMLLLRAHLGVMGSPPPSSVALLPACLALQVPRPQVHSMQHYEDLYYVSVGGLLVIISTSTPHGAQ